jgi:hypothetical protein
MKMNKSIGSTNMKGKKEKKKTMKKLAETIREGGMVLSVGSGVGTFVGPFVAIGKLGQPHVPMPWNTVNSSQLKPKLALSRMPKANSCRHV